MANPHPTPRKPRIPYMNIKVDENNCWNVTGRALDRDGYVIIAHKGRTLKAHRVMGSWIFGGAIRNKCVCHTYDNRMCVNPHHLFLGTNRENTADRTDKGRSAKGMGSGTNKFTDDDIRAIKASNLTGRELAIIYGTSQPYICRIKTNKNWKHIDGNP